MRSLSRLRSVDFYKKIPSDLTEATLTGAGLSIVASVVMALLLVLVCARVRTASSPACAMHAVVRCSHACAAHARAHQGRPPRSAHTRRQPHAPAAAGRRSLRAPPTCASRHAHAQELSAFMRVQTVSEMVVDRSDSSELLKVTFNIRWARAARGVGVGGGSGGFQEPQNAAAARPARPGAAHADDARALARAPPPSGLHERARAARHHGRPTRRQQPSAPPPRCPPPQLPRAVL